MKEFLNGKETAKSRNWRRKQTKKKTVERDGKCLQCGSTENLTVDHIIPQSLRVNGVRLIGKYNISNFQTLCYNCNTRKGNKFNH